MVLVDYDWHKGRATFPDSDFVTRFFTAATLIFVIGVKKNRKCFPFANGRIQMRIKLVL